MKHKHHKLPKYLGGNDEQDNIEYLTIKEHANAHKKLYETYGNWQDRVAWLGLAGIKSHEECLRMSFSEGGKKGAAISNKKQGEKRPEHRKHKSHSKPKKDSKLWGNQHTAGKYNIVYPDGSVVEIVGLSKWCRDNNLNFKAFHKAVVQRKCSHKGYKLWA